MEQLDPGTGTGIREQQGDLALAADTIEHDTRTLHPLLLSTFLKGCEENWRATKIILGPALVPSIERFKGLSLFSLSKKIKSDSISV